MSFSSRGFSIHAATRIEAYAHFYLGIAYAVQEDYSSAVQILTVYKRLVPREEADKADQLLASVRQSMRKQS